MFEHFYCYPGRIKKLRKGKDGSILEGFVKKLHQSGYARITAQKHIRAISHLIYWADKKGIPISNWSGKLILDFGSHLDWCQCPGFGRSNRMHLLNSCRLFLEHLKDTRVTTSYANESNTQDFPLFVEFCRWMRRQRGTRDSTLYNYSHSILDFLKHHGEDPCKFDADSLRQFVLERSQRSGWAAAKTCTTALRMFIRFLIAEGKCNVGLDAAIPALAHWRLSSLPRYLQQEEVECIISSCDPGSPIGKRDRAILLLLARLALRAGDIIQLRLNDIDWKRAEIRVSGKGRRQTLLPLTQEVGNALVAYLQDGRPRADTDILFIRSRAPYRSFSSHCAVSVIVAKAMRRAGITCQRRGAAHIIRHSVATSMLRQGASLQDIAAILRHRSLDTTQIYAKVDVTTLQQIVQPWPEVHPC